MALQPGRQPQKGRGVDQLRRQVSPRFARGSEGIRRLADGARARRRSAAPRPRSRQARPRLDRNQEAARALGSGGKDFAQAEQIFEELAHDSPADAWLRNQLALVLVEQPEEPKRRRALDLAELSVRQNPKAADALATLGTVYFQLKRLDDAQKLLQAVVGSGQGNSDAAYFLARVQADRGQPDAAPALLKLALDAPRNLYLPQRCPEMARSSGGPVEIGSEARKNPSFDYLS